MIVKIEIDLNHPVAAMAVDPQGKKMTVKDMMEIVVKLKSISEELLKQGGVLTERQYPHDQYPHQELSHDQMSELMDTVEVVPGSKYYPFGSNTNIVN